MDKKYYGELVCGHCRHRGLSKVLADYSERDRETLTSPCGYLISQSARPWGVGYSLSLCLSCDKPTLTRIEWHDDFGPRGYSYDIVYPAEESLVQVLPAEVKDAYLAARRFNKTHPETCAAYLRRALELVCADRRARGESLCAKIGDLAGKGEIPLKLFELVSTFENQAKAGRETEFLQSLCEAVFGYVYYGPALLERLERRCEEK